MHGNIALLGILPATKPVEMSWFSIQFSVLKVSIIYYNTFLYVAIILINWNLITQFVFTNVKVERWFLQILYWKNSNNNVSICLSHAVTFIPVSPPPHRRFHRSFESDCFRLISVPLKTVDKEIGQLTSEIEVRKSERFCLYEIGSNILRVFKTWADVGERDTYEPWP